VQGVFKKIRAKIAGKISETDAAKSFKQSDAFQDLQKYKKEY
jgi:hypothetical protein